MTEGYIECRVQVRENLNTFPNGTINCAEVFNTLVDPNLCICCQVRGDAISM
jgi:hypothetical protein